MFNHNAVLLQPAVEGLNIQPDGVYIDGTFGRGGHSQAILNRLGTQGRLLAIDQDPAAIDYAQTHIQDPRFEIQYGSFAKIVDFCRDRGYVGLVRGVLLDLGVSSPQLDDASRGFSFMRKGPLDMRMNPKTGLSAKAWLAQVDEQTLKKVLSQYGEERYAGRIARAIKAAVEAGSLQTTLDLSELVKRVSPRTEKHKHPATRTFQAIRIAVNGELEALHQVLEGAVEVLAPGGRLSVISFHSLEDRIVKQFMRDKSVYIDLFPESPVPVAGVEPVLKRVGKPIFPSEMEQKQNSRARSAVLRVAEKLV